MTQKPTVHISTGQLPGTILVLWADDSRVPVHSELKDDSPV